ncbi:MULTISPECIES: HPF/RaiA family ribosome-associated protein [Methylococcus]|uniref:HPF/RaiA family ribosome-associated protein n=1 Tax=Methylococcus capsulatus TaxID=414 RepID=A0ABZ2F3K3_METCP|nr:MULTISPECIES: HPF/RaiA family ribosome-associated protein [Methylococcus]MDF9392150.1 ribosome-associated translation inhibitor RaiA [Methylococcus capsulatus]
MQVPLEITFRGIPHSDAVETRIREKADKLEQFCDHIISCRVAVEAEHHHQHQGNLYHVRIDLAVPNKHLVVSREHHDKQAHEDVYVALRDAFDAIKRQLEEYVRIQRGEVKNHQAPQTI